MSSLFSRSKDPARSSRTPVNPPSPSAPATKSPRHERDSRLNSGASDGVRDRPVGQTSDGVRDRPVGQMTSETYAMRRENRLAARRAEQAAAGTGDYKKMYEEALATNERLKTRLEGSKQELVAIQTQLERVNQRKGKAADSCRSNVQLETEKQERRVLEKKISDMEEELKVRTDLKMENQRLKDENGALIRVISKLSK